MMSEKRVLLVGDGNHQFIINYAQNLSKASNGAYTVDIFSTSTVKLNNCNVYNRVFHVKDNWQSRFFYKVYGARRFYRFYKYKLLLKKLEFYDIVHFHFIRKEAFFIVHRLPAELVGKIIFSIWGSDLYRLKKRDRTLFLRSCRKADFLTFANEDSKKYFIEDFSWSQENLRMARFGSKPLEAIKELLFSKNDCKKALGWNENKLAIVIGYNMAPAQQHLAILEQLASQSFDSYREKLLLILPITYVGSKAYRNEILNKLKNMPFEYHVYDQFLSDIEVAMIRKASDIMLQLQKTDQFSGSMQEHLFSRTVVVTGSWLPYRQLRESGVWFLSVDYLGELQSVIPDVVDNYYSFWDKTRSNPELIFEFLSWERNISSWISIYEN